MEVGGKGHAPATLPPGMIRDPLYRRLGGSQVPVFMGTVFSPPTGIRSPDRPAHSQLLCNEQEGYLLIRKFRMIWLIVR